MIRKERGELMKGLDTNRYAVGVFLTLLGGSSLAEVTISNHGGFWISVIVFAVGLALCVDEFLRK